MVFVETAYTIVVPDRDLLSRLCGTNDSNLHLIEQHLGVPVFTEGNELSLGRADDQVVRQFQHIVDRIMDEAAAGFDVGPDLMASILRSIPMISGTGASSSPAPCGRSTPGPATSCGWCRPCAPATWCSARGRQAPARPS